MKTVLAHWRWSLLLLAIWAAFLPLILGGNWLRARYGGADYPAWMLVSGWLLFGVLIGLRYAVAIRAERGRR